MILLRKINFSKIFTFFLFCSSLTLKAQGDLMVYPKRIVFEDTKKAQQLSLSNTGNDTARFVISVVQIRMKEDGQFETITTPDSEQHFADKNFRLFPRSVVLGPKEAQTVKIQVIKANELEPGEYRSHIYIRAEEEKKPLTNLSTTKNTSSLSINLAPVFGFSIPVIIKVGESTTKINLSDLALKNTNSGLTISFKVNRSGNMSVYGDIIIDHISPTGKTTQVGLLKGVAVYSPTKARKFQIALDNTRGIPHNSGKLHITFSEQQPKAAKLAEADLNL
jgi:hypothetical protein